VSGSGPAPHQSHSGREALSMTAVPAGIRNVACTRWPSGPWTVARMGRNSLGEQHVYRLSRRRHQRQGTRARGRPGVRSGIPRAIAAAA